jgi:hypothetical protein
MIVLSIIGLLRTVVTIIIIYFSLKLLARIFLPLLLKKLVNKVAQHQFGNSQESAGRKEGEITVDYVPKRDDKRKEVEGDFTDYEEIK